MLRALVALLLLANLLFFAWSQGALSPTLPLPHQDESEPERLAMQVRPEAVVVLGPAAVDAAIAASGSCMEAGPFSEAEFAAAEAALAAAGVPAIAWVRRERQQPARWLVYIGRFADPAALRAKQEQLRRLDVSYEMMSGAPELTPGFVLSAHDNPAAAEAALAAALQRGVRTARVVAQTERQLNWLRLASADEATRKTLEGLSLPPGTSPFAACPAAP